MLIIPVTLRFEKKPGEFSQHRNLLLFNYARNEIEWFEPHGDSLRVGTPEYRKKLNSYTLRKMQDFVKFFNLVNNKPPLMRLFSPPDLCPLKVRKEYFSLQSLEHKKLM